MPFTDIKPIIDHVLSKCPITKCGYRPNHTDTNLVCYGCIHYKDGDYPMLVSKEGSMQTERLKYVGDKEHTRYTGGDIDCRKGDIVFVSLAQKHQMLKDHGAWFEKVDAEAKVDQPPTEEKKPVSNKAKKPAPEPKETDITKIKDLIEFKKAAEKEGITTFGKKRKEIEAEYLANKG